VTSTASTTAPVPTGVQHRPPEPVRPLLTRDYLGFTQPAGSGESWLAPPVPVVTVIINTGAAFGGLPRAFAAGLSDAPGVVEQYGEIQCVDLKLTPLGAHRLLGVPMSELTGLTVDLTAVLGREAGELTDRLAEASTWPARFALLDEFLLARTSRGPEPAPEVALAWARLVACGGAVRIGRLADEVGWSRRHLTARFHQQIGLSPKTAARIIRFETLLRRLSAGGEPARVAVECGYYDQSHMDRDFREFAATTPGAFLARLPRRAPEVTSVQYPWVPAS
jgi:AraC-like DNA-binding protein